MLGTNNYPLIVTTYFHLSRLIVITDFVSAEAFHALEKLQKLWLG